MVFTRTFCAVRTTKSGILFSILLFFLRRVCYNGASIMKKVYSAGFPASHFCSFLPSHPARGRRILPHLAGEDALLHDHTPQGDVGFFRRRLILSASISNHTPQGDVGFFNAAHITPSGGLNHTPQGDVGFFIECTIEYDPAVVITPRKGTLDNTP